MGEFSVRWSALSLSLQTVLSAESDTFPVKLNCNGMMTTGTFVVADPEAGSVPIIVKLYVVPR